MSRRVAVIRKREGEKHEGFRNTLQADDGSAWVQPRMNTDGHRSAGLGVVAAPRLRRGYGGQARRGRYCGKNPFPAFPISRIEASPLRFESLGRFVPEFLISRSTPAFSQLPASPFTPLKLRALGSVSISRDLCVQSSDPLVPEFLISRFTPPDPHFPAFPIQTLPTLCPRLASPCPL